MFLGSDACVQKSCREFIRRELSVIRSGTVISPPVRRTGGERNKWHKKGSWGHRSVGENKKNPSCKISDKIPWHLSYNIPSIYDGQQRRSPLFPTQDFFGDKKGKPTTDHHRLRRNKMVFAVVRRTLFSRKKKVTEGGKVTSSKDMFLFFPPQLRRRPSIKNVTFEKFIVPLRIYISFPYFLGGF